VVFEDGQPKKEHYRKFKLKRPEGTPDDYASMKEVISRRLVGSLRRSKAFTELPDLILIDGGKGQLNAALEVMDATHPGHPCPGPAVIGLAKRNEEIFVPGASDPIILPRHSRALHLIQRIRDEAHRFAITYHRGLRGRTMRVSVLNDIPGIGPKRRKALLRHFRSVERIKNASIEELIEVPSINKSAAEAIYVFFQNV
jgi:excinuclease ABC subunit C